MAIMLFVGSLCGCGQKKIVIVTDPSGKPVEGATVSAIALTMDDRPNMTDSKGQAILPENIQCPTMWIHVYKSGYERVLVNVPDNWPALIILRPVSKP